MTSEITEEMVKAGALALWEIRYGGQPSDITPHGDSYDAEMAMLAEQARDVLTAAWPHIEAQVRRLRAELERDNTIHVTASQYYAEALAHVERERDEAIRLADIRRVRIDELTEDGHRVSHDLRDLIAERDGARAEAKRLRPVIEAARAWRKAWTTDDAPMSEVRHQLAVAVEALDAERSGPTRPNERYMMATRAEHVCGDLSRDEPDLAIIYDQDETHYIGNWRTGFGFINARFPKATTRELTNAECVYYAGKDVEDPGGFVNPALGTKVTAGQGLTTGHALDAGGCDD